MDQGVSRACFCLSLLGICACVQGFLSPQIPQLVRGSPVVSFSVFQKSMRNSPYPSIHRLRCQQSHLRGAQIQSTKQFCYGSRGRTQFGRDASFKRRSGPVREDSSLRAGGPEVETDVGLSGEVGKLSSETKRVDAKPWVLQAILLSLCGAGLGPFLDGYHSAFGVLKYAVPKAVTVGGVFLCETDFWVPPLFGVAGLILGLAYPLLDEVFDVPQQKREPSWPAIFSCISFFTMQYYMSGALSSVGMEGLPLHLFLVLTMAVCIAIWDVTPTGIIMATATGILGPLVEVGLLQVVGPLVFQKDLYRYLHPDVAGIPLWIPWVYACGAPAVGNLGRGVWNSLRS